jgi:hypothetical protein
MGDLKRRVDKDGVVHIDRPRSFGVAWVIAALVFALVCVVASSWLVSGDPLPEVPQDAREPRVEAPRLEAPTVRRDSASQLPTTVPASAEVRMDEGEGEKTGLALFHPGTKPIKRGLVVPENFELPPGYLRHYQTMDDGRQLPAILMFHPDFKPTDANGQPVELPEHRVVPPALAPPGLPLTLLEVPEPLEDPPSGLGDGE